ncbi:MAG: alpha-L-rhamnosidase, partial [Chloroflexota bacterium]|nr:alpha-L-rhamnosidase [Chloroflexota bacterium]
QEEAAYRLLTQKECPSWLYPVTMGATTIWERWDSMLPDGSVNPGEMTSFNHYALGAVAGWLHRTVGGLAPAEPGYRRLELRPTPGGGITSARARHRTPYGLAECAWSTDGHTMAVEATVPPGTTATVVLPASGADPLEVGSGSYRWSYEAIRPPRPAVSLDSTLGELIEDFEAWDVAIHHVPELARRQGGPPGFGAMTLRQLLDIRPTADESRAALEAALAALSLEREPERAPPSDGAARET